MLPFPIPRFLLTNDDGIDAPGLAALAQVLDIVLAADPQFQSQMRSWFQPWVMVAPQAEQSGCGHQVTVANPIAVEARSPQHYAVAGTPADCVRLALSQLCPDLSPGTTWILSGINAGGNLGLDTYLSGTVGAVREAAAHGFPAIALSQYRKGRVPLDWSQTARLAAKVLPVLLARPLPPKQFWNVNFPHWQAGDREPEMVFCQPSTDPLPVAYEATPTGYRYVGRYGDRLQAPESDVAVCFGGDIAITQLAV